MQRREAALSVPSAPLTPSAPTAGAGGMASSRALADVLADAGVDIDELGSLLLRRLRAEFRIDRERFGRLRDSTR